MLVEHRLALGRVDVHSACEDHVHAAVAYVIEALGVAIGDITHAEEATVKVAARGIGPVVVLGEPRVSDHELASSSVWDLVAVGAGQPDLLSGYRLATGPGLAQLILG